MDFIFGMFILWALGETMNEAQNTLDFPMKLEIDFPQLSMLEVLLGTQIWDRLVNQHLLDPEL